VRGVAGGRAVTVHVRAKPEKRNVLCHVGERGEPGLVLIHHMDVVPAKAQEWSVPPFSARSGTASCTVADARHEGPRVAHWCAALRAAKAGILRRKLFLVANADEEVGGGEGAEYFVRNLPFPIGPAYGMNEGGVGVTDIFGGGGKFFLLNMWEKGAGVDEAVRGGEGGGTAAGHRRRTPGAPDSGVDARDGTPGAGAANGACPGHAAGAAGEGVFGPRRGRVARGAEEAAALESLGAGSPRSIRCCGTRSRERRSPPVQAT